MLHTVYFFGCDGCAGHDIRTPRGCEIPREDSGWQRRMECLDGSLAPDDGDVQKECIAQAWRLTGFTPIPYSALSWWDRSVDRRKGSNIILFAPGHTVAADAILNLGRQHFARIPSLGREIEILPDWREKVHSR